jgi:hypothetical protein
MCVMTQQTKLTLWFLLLGGPVLCAQTPLELGSKTDFFVTPDGGKLITRDDYLKQYRIDNSFQASNAVEVSVKHLDDTAVVVDQRKKASPKETPKTNGPVISISLLFSRPIFDPAFGTFSAEDMVQIRSALAKFKQWKNESATGPFGSELRRPFPAILPWPVAVEANNEVTLTEQPLLFLHDPKGAAFLLLDKDKVFPAGMEKIDPAATLAGAAAGGGAAAAAPAAGAADGTAGGGAGAKAKVVYVDHWMSDGDVAVFEATLNKVEELLKKNRSAIQKLQ